MDKKLLLVIGACAVALVGCKSKAGLVGDWTGTEPAITGGTSDVEAKFNADGTYSLIRGSGQLKSEIDGTYTYDDSSKQVTLTQQKMMIGGQEVKVTGGGAIFGKGQPSAVAWNSGDEVTIKMAMGDLSLKRK